MNPYGHPGGMPPYGGMPPPPGMFPMHHGMPSGPGYGQPMMRPGVQQMPGASQEQAPKVSITMYIGNLPSSVSDDFIQELIGACGTVRSWKRLQDPDTGKLKNFGFVEYASVEDLIRAKEVMTDAEIDGEKLTLKTSSATDQYTEWYLRNKEAKKAAGAKDSAGGADLNEEDEEMARTEEARQKVGDLVRSRGNTTEARMADELIASLEGGEGRLPAPPSRGRSPPRGGPGGGRRRSPSPGARGRGDGRGRDGGRFDRDRERDEARDYRRKLQAWEKREQDRIRDWQRQQRRQKDVEAERQRLVKEDEAEVDSDIAEELWRRKPMVDRKGTSERRRRMERERKEDEEDREKEKAEEEQRKRKEREAEDKRLEEERAAKEAAAAAAAADNAEGPPQGGPAHTAEGVAAASADGRPGDTKADGMVAAGLTPPRAHAPPAAGANPQIGEDDPILRAMQEAAMKGTTGSAGGTATQGVAISVGGVGSGLKIQGNKPQWGVRIAAKGPGKGLQGVFGEEDDDKPKMAPLPTMAPAAGKKEEESKGGSKLSKESMKELIAQIPGTWQGIVNYQIDWVVYDSMVADERVRKQLTAWVGKKIKEYLGDEEPSLAEFIMGKVGEHASPSGMHDMMKEILDNDTKNFLLKLFRTIIYETLKWKEKKGK